LATYPQQPNREARWKTLVAWAGQDARDAELLADVGYDNWQLSHSGRREANSLRQRFEIGELDVRRRYMWRPKFKQFMCSSYIESTLDSERPPHIYEDQVPYDPGREALWLLHEINRRHGRGE